MLKRITALVSLLTLVLVNCASHKPNDSRSVAYVPNLEDYEVKQEYDNMRKIVSEKNSVELRNYFTKMRISQVLVSSFDERIRNTKTEEEHDALMGSQLYCNLARTKTIHEHAEKQINSALTFAKDRGRHFEEWFYEQMSAFIKNSDKAFEASMIQTFRMLVSEEEDICFVKGCVAQDLTMIKGFSVNPLDDDKVTAFMKLNHDSIAFYGQPLKKAKQDAKSNRSLKSGDCVQKEEARKPNASGYDWVNRNWMGSVLPTGQFVFTYDDGPHSKHTLAIRDAWTDAGLAKPAFFWLRKNATALPEIVKELNDDGFVIASHSERHADLGNLAKASSSGDFNGVNKQVFGGEVKNLPAGEFQSWKTKTLDREIIQSVQDLSKIIGKPVRYFRLPFGSGVKNELIGERFQTHNLDHFFWRVDSLDWQDKNPSSVFDRVVEQMNTTKKGIVLFHDIHSQSVEASKLLVNYLKSSSTHKAVHISELPGLKP